MATAGVDGTVKLWDCRSWKDALRSWNSRGGNATLAWSQRGCLAVASGGAVNVGTIFGLHYIQVIINASSLARCIPRHQYILPTLGLLHLHYT
jgi:WD40 repeat protein